MTSAALRRRWADPVQAKPLLDDAFALLEGVPIGRTVDLRGAEIGMDGPLSDFRFLTAVPEKVDLSFGKGALIIVGASVDDLVAERFAFDRASYMRRSTLRRCSFQGARMRLDVTDCEFIGCDFANSSFAGGSKEYGFRRCTFHQCSFANIAWRNTYLRACEMHDCDFDGAVIATSIVAGLKIRGVAPHPDFLVSCEVVGLVVNDKRIEP